MYLLHMKDVNFIFSIFFVLWCTVHLISTNKESSDFHKAFGYGFQEKEVTVFWMLVICLTSFNFIARFTSKFQYYLIGAAGMIVICAVQLFFVLTFIKIYISGFSGKEDIYDVSGRFTFILFTIPYILFGILSSLTCYRQELNEKTDDQNHTKFQRIFLKLYLIDYQAINCVYHLSISTCMLVLFVMTVKMNSRHDTAMIVILVPLIPTLFTCFAYFSKQINFYRGAIFCWALLAIFFIVIFIDPLFNIDESRHGHIPVIISFGLICFINSLVGFLSATLTYHKKKIENSFENPNYVTYVATEDGVTL